MVNKILWFDFEFKEFLFSCHLKKKDLSFNNIEKIEGLENLNKLKDISLFNNQISKLENMNNLENLEVFSIGNNQLSDYSNVKFQFFKIVFLPIQLNNNFFHIKDFIFETI